jgi:hypothetical protein
VLTGGTNSRLQNKLLNDLPSNYPKTKIISANDDGENDFEKMNPFQVWGPGPHLSQTVRKALNMPQHQFADFGYVYF